MKIKKILPFIGLSIFIYLVYKTGPLNILSGFKDITLNYFLIFMFLLIIAVTFLAFKWGFILKKQNIQLPFLYILKTYLISIFYGAITPARAGSLIRAYYIKNKTNKSLIESSSSIVIERALDLLVIIFLSFLGSLFLFNHILPDLITKLLISFFLIIGVCLFFISEKRSKLVFSLVSKYILPKSLREKADSSLSSFYKTIPSPKNIILFIILTFIAWILIAIKSTFMARAFSIEIPFITAATIFLISIAVGTIPITVGGLGTREVALVTLFGLFDVPAAKAMSMSITLFLTGSILPALIGFLLSLKEEKIQKNEILNNNSPSSK